MGLILRPVVKKMDKNYKKNGNIKWNFTKILIDKNGEIIGRFEPTADMEVVRQRIMEVL